MTIPDTVNTRLKTLREEAGLSIREMADALNMKTSSYNHYESRFKKQYLPHEFILKLIPILKDYGIESTRVRALGASPEGPAYPENPGFMEAASPKIDVSVLLNEQDAPTNKADDPSGTIKLAIVGDTIQIAATVDSDGIDELIRRIELARQMIE
ncbi:MAG: helix-turn-helix transcriptional regulator [Hyphomicrobiales bacterium]